jgi:hypothetical protein
VLIFGDHWGMRMAVEEWLDGWRCHAVMPNANDGINV